MFDFERLSVYKRAKEFNSLIREVLRQAKEEGTSKNQLRRAAFSIVLNIAEGTGRSTNADKRNFYIIARVPIFDLVPINLQG